MQSERQQNNNIEQPLYQNEKAKTEIKTMHDQTLEYLKGLF